VLKQAKVLIKGDVIGVGFRAWTVIQAKNNDVKGWVRNVFPNVEALLQGRESKIKQMLTKLKEGSPVGRVDEVKITWEEPQEVFSDFAITG